MDKMMEMSSKLLVVGNLRLNSNKNTSVKDFGSILKLEDLMTIKLRSMRSRVSFTYKKHPLAVFTK